MTRMIGKLGWKGQCSCCNGNKDVKAEEKHLFNKEVQKYLFERSEEESGAQGTYLVS